MVGARDGLKPHSFGERLASARDFVEIGVTVCEIASELGLDDCTVALYESDGRPSLLVDRSEVDDQDRLDYVTERWLDDTWLRELLEHSAPVIREVGRRTRILLPILATGYVLGSIRCHVRELADTVRRDLHTLASYVSVRAAELKINAQPDPTIGSLTRRQLDVAMQMARGRTNAEIAARLGLSENTVKKHLKDVFARLGVANRTECAARLRHDAPRNVLPIGVTRVGDIAITSANH